MSYPQLKSFESKLDSKSRKHELNDTFKISDGVAVQATLFKPSDHVRLTVRGSSWAFHLDQPSKDVALEIKRGSVTMIQRVPAGKTFLIPSPEIKIKRQFRHRDSSDGSAIDSRVAFLYDAQRRHRSIGSTLFVGLQHRNKLHVSLDSSKGITAGVRHKLDGTPLHSIAAEFNEQRGIELRLKSRPGEGQKGVLVAQPSQKLIRAELQYQPPGSKTKVTATATVPLETKVKSGFTLGVLYKF